MSSYPKKFLPSARLPIPLIPSVTPANAEIALPPTSDAADRAASEATALPPNLTSVPFKSFGTNPEEPISSSAAGATSSATAPPVAADLAGSNSPPSPTTPLVLKSSVSVNCSGSGSGSGSEAPEDFG